MVKPPFALVSDLHANLEATRAVLADIDRQGVHAVVCLGDIVGYGPDPAEVLELTLERAAVTVAGNHDWAVLHGAYGFNRSARQAIEYTRSLLRPRRGRSRTSLQKAWQYLDHLPIVLEAGPYTFVHGSLRSPLIDYCFGDRHSRWDPSQVEEIMAQVRGVCFAGHTHFPVVIRDDQVCWYPSDEEPVLELRPDHKYIVNVGAVGQPRDGDPRACYAILSGGQVRYRRVPYDAARTCRKIERIAAIESRLGERLLLGR